MADVAELAAKLIRRVSITPEDAGCQPLIGERLAAIGFQLEVMQFGAVTNLWARRGAGDPLFCFAGHTDVVPTGPAEQWDTPPFAADIRDGYLLGRGAADMKGSLAAMVCAAERFIRKHPDAGGSLAFLLTSDEEGPALDGTRAVIAVLQARAEHIDYCVIGEPSGIAQSGDRVRIGRRGSLNARLSVHGIQGHVAYPEQSVNPIHLAAPALAELVAHPWDAGTAQFPPTSLQITAVQAGVGASNVTPGVLNVQFNLRYSPAQTAAGIEGSLRAMLDRHALDYTLECTLSGEPFVTGQGALIDAAGAAIKTVTGLAPEFSTGGGTSDGRFIAPTGTEVVELGPPGDTLHQVNERVRICDLETLEEIYLAILVRVLTAA